MRSAFVLLALFILNGCAAVSGYPERPASVSATVSSLDDDTLKKLISEYNITGTSPDRKKEIRNEIIDSDLSQIDLNFIDFKIKLNSQANITSIGTDFISLALAGLGATVGAASTKAALAAASAGVIGAKAAIDKDVLYQQTILALTNEMEAQRNKVYAGIVVSKRLDATQYSLESGARDVQAYYQAGTLVSALQGVSQSASTNKQNSEQQVKNAISLTYNFDSLSSKIQSYWQPDGKNFDQTNQNKIKTCIDSNNIKDSIPGLINGGTQADKSAVIGCLGI